MTIKTHYHFTVTESKKRQLHLTRSWTSSCLCAGPGLSAGRGAARICHSSSQRQTAFEGSSPAAAGLKDSIAEGVAVPLACVIQANTWC